MNALNFIPVIPKEKQYWLVRTQGGRYYRDFKTGGFIAINWDSITFDDIEALNFSELTQKVKQAYPEKKKPGRTANQLRIFHQVIKPGDIVIITSYASSEFSIGEIMDEPPYIQVVTEAELEANPRLCPYQKRRRVKWLKTLHKWDVDKELFKLIQHAQHTISEANNYADSIESHIHNFYIRGNEAHLVLEVKKEDSIPFTDFYRMGNEIIQLVEEFSKETKKFNINLNEIEIKVNVSSPGKITFKGTVLTLGILGFLIVGTLGGGVKIPMPSFTGLEPIEIQLNGALHEISEFLDRKQAREHRDLLLKTYMEHLEVKAPAELVDLLKAVEATNEQNDASEK
jgi:restriction system protein